MEGYTGLRTNKNVLKLFGKQFILFVKKTMFRKDNNFI